MDYGFVGEHATLILHHSLSRERERNTFSISIVCSFGCSRFQFMTLSTRKSVGMTVKENENV